MSNFDSAQWTARRRQLVAELKVAPELTLTIEQRITSDGHTPILDIWHVEIDGGKVTFRAGPHPNPTLTLTGSRTAIDAIRSGKQSAQRAFLDGELEVGGNIAKLLDSHIQLEKVAEALAATSPATT